MVNNIQIRNFSAISLFPKITPRDANISKTQNYHPGQRKSSKFLATTGKKSTKSVDTFEQKLNFLKIFISLSHKYLQNLTIRKSKNFQSNTHVRLIIEGVFFYSLTLSPVCAYLLLSLPSMLAHLLFCRGPGAGG